jgi:hypothetical protein
MSRGVCRRQKGGGVTCSSLLSVGGGSGCFRKLLMGGWQATPPSRFFRTGFDCTNSLAILIVIEMLSWINQTLMI